MSSRWCVNISKLGLQLRKLNCVRVRRNCTHVCVLERHPRIRSAWLFGLWFFQSQSSIRPQDLYLKIANMLDTGGSPDILWPGMLKMDTTFTQTARSSGQLIVSSSLELATPPELSGRGNWRSDWTDFPVVWAILRHHLVHLYSSKCRNWIYFILRNDEFTCFAWVMAYLSSKCLSCDPCLAVNPHLTGTTSFRRPSVYDKSLDRDAVWRWHEPTCPQYVTSYTLICISGNDYCVLIWCGTIIPSNQFKSTLCFSRYAKKMNKRNDKNISCLGKNKITWSE